MARGRVMYAFLVALGAVIAAAGLVLVASGVSIQDHGVDAAIVTQGVIAIIGGCILVGLAFVVRALLRVERALMLRPMARTAASGESVGSVAAGSGEAARIPFPPNPRKAAVQNQPAAIAVEPRAVSAQQTPAETQSAPALAQLENAPVVEESNVSLLAAASARSDLGGDETHSGVAGKLNGAAHAKAAPPRPAASGRPARRAQQGKISIFDSLWPKAQRSAPAVQPPPVPSAPPAQAADEAALAPVAQSAAEPPASTVQIVKSGVVEGMAYTLYSDGSIEAQLPGGILHFRSITELRNHIEKNG